MQPIPVSTSAIVSAAKRCVEAGADSIHFHVRNAVGLESLSAADVSVQVKAINEVLPEVPVGISTGEWIQPDPEKRIDAIRHWDYLPDYVSVNGHEEGFEHVVLALRRKGIRIEAGIRDADAARAFVQSGMLCHCFRILIEPVSQDLAKAIACIEAIEEILLGEISSQTVLLHGVDETAWPLLALAAKKTYESRMGFEDALLLPSGQPAQNNEALIQTAIAHYLPNAAAHQKKA